MSESVRKVRKTQSHVDAVKLASKRFGDWPCITSVSNLRIALDLAEKDFKSGVAASGITRQARRITLDGASK